MSRTTSMYERFSASARAHPDHIALSVGGIDFTYSSLDAAAARAGAAMSDLTKNASGRPPRRIGVLARRTSAGTYIAYLAGHRMGSAVASLNIEFPVERNAEIIRMAKLEVLAYNESDRDLAASLHAETGVGLLRMSDDGADFTGDGPLAPETTPELNDLALLFFTSGSTGAPKGVPLKHRNITAWLAAYLETFTDGPDTRVSQTADLSWALSMVTLWLAWGGGGTVVVPSKSDLLAPSRHIAKDGITHWVSTPSSVTMARWLGDLTDPMPTLRWSLLGGEPLTFEHVQAWTNAAPASSVANIFGPSEAPLCMTYVLPTDPAAWPSTSNGTFPIGQALPPAAENMVIDEDGKPSQEGELVVRGPHRFDGYLNPQHNHERFVLVDDEGFSFHDGVGEPGPEYWYRTGDRISVEEGRGVYLGRSDNQVKVHGYRIEPGDIEAAMRAHPNLENAVVVPCPADDGIVELAGFYTGESISDHELRDFLADRLPTYMAPRFLVRLEGLPLNRNGKVDRRELTDQAAMLVDAKSSAPG